MTATEALSAVLVAGIVACYALALVVVLWPTAKEDRR
jgi:hypothetical protein